MPLRQFHTVHRLWPSGGSLPPHEPRRSCRGSTFGGTPLCSSQPPFYCLGQDVRISISSITNIHLPCYYIAQVCEQHSFHQISIYESPPVATRSSPGFEMSAYLSKVSCKMTLSGVSILMSYGENPHYVKLPIFSEFMENSTKFMKNSDLTKWTQNLR